MDAAHPVTLLLVAFAVAIIPIVLGIASSYLKVSIVLGMVKSALGTQQVPGPLITMSVSLAVTVFIMGPVFESSLAGGVDLDLNRLMTKQKAGEVEKLQNMLAPWREFLLKHSGDRELTFLNGIVLEIDARSKKSLAEGVEGAKGESSAERSAKDERATEGRLQSKVAGNVQRPSNELAQSDPAAATGSPDRSQVSWRVLLLAFVLSELKEAFAMAFMLLIPFLVVDLVIANILAGLGMFMVSPVLIALPVKLILFVVSDGWLFLVRGLVRSYS